jgi:pyruvate/2-oxoglutarate dehydrogenase complex dihydrolipoamide acyltransferase (E2) component
MEVRIPDLGETVVEALVSRWRKREGDGVAVGDVLAELETDKANVELTAEWAGRLVEVRVREGQTAAKGAVVAVIDTDAGAFFSTPMPDAALLPTPMPDLALTPAEPRAPALECLRCGAGMEAASSASRMAFAGQPVHLLVCRRCGHVEMIAVDPTRF